MLTPVFSQGYILNQHYETIAKVRSAQGTVLGDLHEVRRCLKGLDFGLC